MVRSLECPLIVNYIDLTAAFDKIPRSLLFAVLKLRTGANRLIDLLQLLYTKNQAFIAGSEISFPVSGGTRQGGIESPPAFVWYFDYVLKVAAVEIDRELPLGIGVRFSYTISH